MNKTLFILLATLGCFITAEVKADSEVTCYKRLAAIYGKISREHGNLSRREKAFAGNPTALCNTGRILGKRVWANTTRDLNTIVSTWCSGEGDRRRRREILEMIEGYFEAVEQNCKKAGM